MPFRFKRRESVRDGFRRIATEQFDGILADLAGQDEPPNIHGARKRCKSLRALIRLAGAGLGEAEFRRENGGVRDLARSLSAARDAQVRLRTFEQLLSLPGAPRVSPYRPLHEWLRRETDLTRAEALTPSVLAHTRATVLSARARIGRAALGRGGWNLLECGLRRSYRAVRRAFRRAVDAPSDATHHEWRKRVKDLWNHVVLIRAAQPRKLGMLAEQLDALGELLGDDHDLAVLRAHLATPAAPHIAAADSRAFDTLVAHRRESLVRVAHKLGVLACGEKPRVFLERIHGWWKAWRQ